MYSCMPEVNNDSVYKLYVSRMAEPHRNLCLYAIRMASLETFYVPIDYHIQIQLYGENIHAYV